ncbi:MAG: hypothetical protein FJX59_05145 [Alphaproteobacteria bacterium]|nr:hypothetical protein [Alphaproteobacteria bacterium]
MRPIVRNLATANLPWEWSRDGGVGTKVLSRDADTGARTTLLRSKQRPVTEATRRRAHFHRGVEEFLSLGPAFSFDDDHWHSRLSYAYLPAQTVHGTNVQVPDGYLLYLRTHGPTEPLFLAAHGPPENAAQPTIHAPPQESAWQPAAGTSAVVRHLHASENETSFLLRFTAAGDTPFLLLAGAVRYEILVIEGRLAFEQGDVLDKESYACLAPEDCRTATVAAAPALLMVTALRGS